VSRASAADLHLVPGAGVLASFKATAVRLRVLDAGRAMGSIYGAESDERRA
jgi:hypothetical protein